MDTDEINGTHAAHDEQRPRKITLAAFTSLADCWGLDDTQRAILLGLEHAGALHAALERDDPLFADMRTRIGQLMAIYDYLHWSLQKPAFAQGWVTSRNRDDLFGGKTPLELMLAGGLPAIIEVREYAQGMLW